MSGYSKTQFDKSLNTKIDQVLDPYKEIKMMYVVDESGEFEGNVNIQVKFQIKFHFLFKILTLN